LPQFGQATVSAGGGENGDGCGAVTGGIAVAGTDVAIGREPIDGFEMAAGATPMGAGLDGTCMGTEPIPIWTDGAVAGTLVEPKR
jgi:hypothetical protein